MLTARLRMHVLLIGVCSFILCSPPWFPHDVFKMFTHPYERSERMLLIIEDSSPTRQHAHDDGVEILQDTGSKPSKIGLLIFLLR